MPKVGHHDPRGHDQVHDGNDRQRRPKMKPRQLMREAAARSAIGLAWSPPVSAVDCRKRPAVSAIQIPSGASTIAKSSCALQRDGRQQAKGLVTPPFELIEREKQNGDPQSVGAK